MGITSSRNHRMNGHAILLSHDSFEGGWQEARRGNAADVDRLTVALGSLGLQVGHYPNLTSGRIKAVLDNTRMLDFSSGGCLVIAVMTHGLVEGQLCAFERDGFYSTGDIWRPFQNLADVTKIFIFQACRGGVAERVVSSQSLPPQPSGLSEVWLPRLPHDSNSVVAFSSVNDTKSVRNEVSGSWFIQLLCEELARVEEATDLLELLTRVNGAVAQQRNTGEAENVTNPPEQGRAGTSSTDQTGQTSAFTSFLTVEYQLP